MRVVGGCEFSTHLGSNSAHETLWIVKIASAPSNRDTLKVTAGACQPELIADELAGPCHADEDPASALSTGSSTCSVRPPPSFSVAQMRPS